MKPERRGRRKRVPLKAAVALAALASALPLLALLAPGRSAPLSALAAVMPLAGFLCALLVLRRAARRAGKSLRLFMEERTETPQDSALVLQQVLGCSELAVLTTIYTDVVLLKKSRMGVSRSYSIYRYVGRIKTGIQLDRCEFSADSESRAITLRLPPPQVFDHSIDIEDIEKFDEKSSLFCKISNTELFAEITRRKGEAQERLVAHGLLDATMSRARLEVTRLLSAMGYRGYDVNVELLPPETADKPRADSLQAAVNRLD